LNASPVPFWVAEADGVRVRVKVQPKSRRPGLQGILSTADGGSRLRIGVTEAAEGGRANQAACETLASALKVTPSTVSVALGASSREKTLRITGDPALLTERLAAL
jgi:uncharacterized protein YggU (UPF0235/DUF167 family)